MQVSKLPPAKHANQGEMKNRSEDFICKDESYAIMGARFAAYGDKGCGL
jgi:hypothetical protein